jgi:putative ubiquitin-RnfH superfamily antitoxin RatB of RatAB toxin-antitoxin module
MRVEVVYALAGEQDVAGVEVPQGATARDAIEASGILARHPQIDLRREKLGRFGRRIAADARLQDGDRIEILRPLARSPMEARRLRARRRARPAGR